MTLKLALGAGKALLLMWGAVSDRAPGIEDVLKIQLLNVCMFPDACKVLEGELRRA